MKCPRCVDGTTYKIYTTLQVLTEVEIVDDELEVREVTPRGSYEDEEPDKIKCLKCDYVGPPEKFKYFTPEMLRERVQELIRKHMESDSLADLPAAITELMF